jgi:hypothetical protein
MNEGMDTRLNRLKPRQHGLWRKAKPDKYTG